VGTIITCQAVVDWAYQRYPMLICNVKVPQPPPLEYTSFVVSPTSPLPDNNTTTTTATALGGEGGGVRKAGLITKLKVSLKYIIIIIIIIIINITLIIIPIS